MAFQLWIADAERSDRRGLIVIGVVSAVVLTSIVLWGGRDGSSEALPLSARIELAATTVEAGGTIEGRVVITNNTGEAFNVIGCGSIYQVALANEDYEPGPAWTLCAQQFTIPTGQSTYPVTVRATHLVCGHDPSSRVEVPCEDSGEMPSLPAGDYEARLFQGHDGPKAPEPPGVPVRVVGGS